jgi:hypothetical protein
VLVRRHHGGPDGGDQVSRRQDERADRIYDFWMPRFSRAGGRRRAEVAGEYVVARINDLPKRDRVAAFEVLADELVRLADLVTQRGPSQVHFTPAGAVPVALRAQARRAGARGPA